MRHTAAPGKELTMKQITIALSANAGVSVTCGCTRIWADALHNTPTPGYSRVTPGLWPLMRSHPAFVRPDLICYTHLHSDHYDAGLTEEALKCWPSARLALPDEQTFPPAEHTVTVNDVSVTFFPLPHEGAQYAHVAHQGILLDWDHTQILIAGDCATASPALSGALYRMHASVSVAVLPFPWITLRKGRSFVYNIIQPKEICLVHLPFPEEDTLGYLRAVSKTVPQLTQPPGIHVLCQPLQTKILQLS